MPIQMIVEWERMPPVKSMEMPENALHVLSLDMLQGRLGTRRKNKKNSK
jgi:hypothetical protein